MVVAMVVVVLVGVLRKIVMPTKQVNYRILTIVLPRSNISW